VAFHHRNPDGLQPFLLHTRSQQAARDGYADIVRLLIEFGAEVDAAGSERVHTALVLAAHQGHSEIVSLLLDHGADVNKAHPVSGSDALLEAVNQGRTQCVRLLLQAGADPDRAYQTEGGDVRILSVASAKGDTEIVRFLLEHGADLNAEGGDGHTALNVAAGKGHAGVVSLLLGHGADPLKINPVNGSDALLPAVIGKQVECVRLLLEAGANPDRTYPGELSSGGSRDIPILIIASENGDAEIVRLLLEHGADLNADVGDGMTALRRAGVNSYKDVEQVLIEFGADPSTRLVKFTDTPAGREMENEVLSRLAAGLDEVASKIRTIEAGDTPDEAVPETRPRGFFAGLFGWGRRP
jgi:ankyrin repeat protein